MRLLLSLALALTTPALGADLGLVPVTAGSHVDDALAAQADQAIAAAVRAEGQSAVALPAGCDDACAKGQGVARALSAKLSRIEGALLITLTLSGGGNARAGGIDAAQLLAAIPGAVHALLGRPGHANPPRAAVSGQGAAPQAPRAPAPEAKKPADDPWAQQTSASTWAPLMVKPKGFTTAEMDKLVEETAGEVETVRGLKRKSKLRYQILEQAAFSAALKRGSRMLSAAQEQGVRARWVAFGFARALADPAKIEGEIYDDHILGFYDPRDKVLYVRKEQRDSVEVSSDDLLRRVLAHEIEHALQDQNFGLADLARISNADERLARRSLYEGDAVVTEIAYEAHHQKRPPRLLVGVHAANLRSVDLSVLLHDSGYSSELAGEPEIVREESALPYVHGFGLVSDVFRRGGFPLVNEMFAHAPQSSLQILHSDTYLAGGQVTPVPFPSGPRGAKVLEQGHLGALGAKVMLASCVEPSLALDAAGSWTGDAYTVVSQGHGKVALVWRTTWRDEESARTFKNLIDMLGTCWEEVASRTEAEELSVGKQSAVLVDGLKVAVVRGFSESETKKLASAALDFKANALALAPPLGKQDRLLADEGAALVQDRYRSTRLAFQARVPPGFRGSIDDPLADFTVHSADGAPAYGSITFVPEPVTEKGEKELFDAFRRNLLDLLPSHVALVQMPEGTTSLLGRKVAEHTWKLQSSVPLVFSIATMPACKGKAFFSVVRVALEEKGSAGLSRWVQSFEQTEPLPACTDLE